MAAQHPRAAAKKRGRELPFSRRPRLLDRNTHMHSYEGLPIWAASKVTTLPLSGDGARGSTDQFPRYAAEVAGLNVDVIVAGNSPAGLAAKNDQDNSHCHCDDGGPGATRIRHEPRSPGRQHHVAQPPDAGLPRTGLPFVSKLPVTWWPLGPFPAREASKASGTSRPINMRVSVNGTIVRWGREWRKRAPSRARGEDDAQVRDRA
jgi:hypothetical protein